MLQQKVNLRTTILLFIILVVAALRLLTQLTEHSNSLNGLTPLAAIALFGGAQIKGNIKPFLFPLLALFGSDIVLCFTVYADFREGLLYPGWYWVYGAFALITLAGKLIIKNVTTGNVLLAIVVATLIHWLVTNIGECVGANSAGGFINLYTERLSSSVWYELKILLATLVYGLTMFGSFELARRKLKVPNLTIHHLDGKNLTKDNKLPPPHWFTNPY